MTTALKLAADSDPAAPDDLPPQMRVLFVATAHRKGGWVADAFAAEAAAEIRLHDAVGTTAALARLREEPYDLVLLSHAPDDLDALDFLRALRAGGSEEPVIVLGDESEQQMSARCFDAGADGYVCVNTITARTLTWIAARAIERHRLLREHRALSQADRHRLRLEQTESRRMLAELRSVVRDVRIAWQNGDPACTLASSGASPDGAGGPIPPAPAPDDVQLPPQLIAHYRDLLRAYVIMGSGNLGRDVAALAELLAAAGVSARQAMAMHLDVLQELVAGLGNRSTRHVMTRADLLLLELTVHLAESYRRRYRERRHPPQQLLLPGFAGDVRPLASAA
jgi:CheY-like chemotaxis protein